MKKRFFTIVIEDADLWKQNGLTPEEEDAVVIALWKWRRGRADDSALSVPAKLVYAPMVARWKQNDPISEVRSEVGKRGAEARWKKVANGKGNGKGMPKHECPTTSPTPSPTTSNLHNEGNMVANPAASHSKQFVKPTADDVRVYCSAHGIANVDAEQFVDYYDSTGWMVGKVRMKDWQATVRNWSRRHSQSGRHNTSPVGLVFKNSSKENYYEEL